MLLLLLSRFSRVRLLATMDFSLPGFSVYGIVQARVLEWVAIAFCTSAKTPYQNQQGLQPQRRVPPTAQVRVPQDRRPLFSSSMPPVPFLSPQTADSSASWTGVVPVPESGDP